MTVKLISAPDRPHKWTGDTAGLLKLHDQGKRLVYDAAGAEWFPGYAPRTKYDPQPWQAGDYRFKSSELTARCRLGGCPCMSQGEGGS